jgi:hypothetical protein
MYRKGEMHQDSLYTPDFKKSIIEKIPASRKHWLSSTSTVIRQTTNRKKMSNTSNQTVVKMCRYHHKNIYQ